MKKVLHIAFLILAYTACFAQYKPLSTAYIYNGISLNPAYCGSLNSFTLVGGYRNQWTGLEGSPKTANIAFHGPLKKDHVALGVQLTNDRIGLTNTTHVSGTYAYRITNDESTISFGIEGGVKQIVNNWSNAKVNDNYDPNFSSSSGLMFMPDFSAGIMYYTKMFQAGLSIRDLFGSNKYILTDFTRKNINLHVSREFVISEKFHVHPIFLTRYVVGRKLQFDAATQLEWNNLVALGGAYRLKESFAAYMVMRFKHNVLITYSYDVGINPLATYNGGSHQIILRYNFLYKINASNPRMF